MGAKEIADQMAKFFTDASQQGSDLGAQTFGADRSKELQDGAQQLALGTVGSPGGDYGHLIGKTVHLEGVPHEILSIKGTRPNMNTAVVARTPAGEIQRPLSDILQGVEQ